jgi:hypothetical protein
VNQAAPPGGGIGDWSVSRLIKFVREVFEKDPPLQLVNLTVDSLRVRERLTVDKQMVYGGKLFTIGTTGAPSFENSWSNFNTTDNTSAAYYRDAEGFVRLTGLIAGGVVGSRAFTLPPGFRPGKRVILATISNGALGRITVEANGEVIPASPSSSAWVSLDGLFFRAN